MVWAVLIIGYLAIGLCLVILAAPKVLRRIIDFFSFGSRLYLAGILRLFLGLAILILSAHSRLWGYVVTLGLLAAASGLSLFFFALRRTKKLLARIQNQSDFILRLCALTALVIWALLVYALLPAAAVLPLR